MTKIEFSPASLASSPIASDDQFVKESADRSWGPAVVATSAVRVAARALLLPGRARRRGPTARDR
jgi:hypothetical protein